MTGRFIDRVVVVSTFRRENGHAIATETVVAVVDSQAEADRIVRRHGSGASSHECPTAHGPDFAGHSPVGVVETYVDGIRQ